MLVLIVGIVLFLGAHSFTTFRTTRLALIAWFGAGAYKGVYSLVSLIGFALIVCKRQPMTAV